VLGPGQDAEDAFQATFIVLIRKAGTVRWKTSIAAWLYQVAHRVALRCRARIAQHKAALADHRIAAPPRLPESSDDDRRTTIEEEIARLPESLRLPVVMCYIEGLTNGEAASRIGCPEGTVASRLARARERLRRRLRARGIAVVGTSALVDALWDGASAALAPSLENATVGIVGQTSGAATASGVLSVAAVRLGHEIAQQISWRRLLQYGAVIVAGTAIVGSFLVVSLGLWSTDREPDAAWAPGGPDAGTMMAMDPQMRQMAVMAGNPGPNEQRRNAAIAALQGSWNLDNWQVQGEVLPVSPDEQRIEFAGDRCILLNITGNKPGPVIAQAIVDSEDPEHIIDFIIDPDDQPRRVPCLYELVDGTLRLSIAPNGPRPGGLSSGPGDRHFYYVFKRPKPSSAASEPPRPPD
jgi:RNA polymerase sigma factor (sigma-70 family)